MTDTTLTVGVYFCNCGCGEDGQISSKIDAHETTRRVAEIPGVAYADIVDFSCSDGGQEQIVADLIERRPDRVVIAACTPRQHEATFRDVLTRAGMNPYLMQLINIREQVAWVTDEPDKALDKAVALISAGVARVQCQEPLESTSLDVCTDALVIGGGPAGLKAALTLAEAGRRVTLVDKASILGGLPVRFEEIFPNMECAPCLLEPILNEVLHGPHSELIDIHLMSEVVGLKGSFGNFEVRIRRAPRHVSVMNCVGCGACIEACPVSVPDPLALGRLPRKAIDFELFGGLPSVPVLDFSACRRGSPGEECSLCRESCPVDDTILYDDTETFVERTVGAVIVAVGASVYDLGKAPDLGYGHHPDILSSWDIERMLSQNGPTGGALEKSDGQTPAVVALVLCAASLEPDHVPYCSGICCQSAFKYMHQVRNAHPDTSFVCFYKTIVASGKEGFANYAHATANPNVRWIQYRGLTDLEVRVGADQALAIAHQDSEGHEQTTPVDLVMLMSPVVPAERTAPLAGVLEIGVDPSGFLQELNPRSDATCSNVRGIYIAGACQAPMDIQQSMTQGAAASGHVLAALVQGRKLIIDPMTAFVDQTRCSGCYTCIPVCPYKAIDFDAERSVAIVNGALCAGCGTCVAACPTAAMQGRHFTGDALIAEIEAVMA